MGRYRFLLLVLIACGIFSFSGLIEARSVKDLKILAMIESDRQALILGDWLR